MYTCHNNITVYILIKIIICNVFIVMWIRDCVGNIEMYCETTWSFDGLSVLAMLCGIKSGLSSPSQVCVDHQKWLEMEWIHG